MARRAAGSPLLPSKKIPGLLFVFCFFAAAASAAPPPKAVKPSRKALKGCKWEKLSDPSVGLEVFAQKCDYGFRKIDFLLAKNALSIRYSDGGAPEPVVEVFALHDGETPEAGVKRLWTERTPKFFHERCVVAPYGKPPLGAAWLTVEPAPAYAAQLKAKQDPNEVPPPPCGDWGSAPDGIQYWEAHPKESARRVLFVRAGQDPPLFDERTLKILPPR